MEKYTPPDSLNKNELTASPESKILATFQRMQDMYKNLQAFCRERKGKSDATFANTFDYVGVRTFQLTLILGALASLNHARTRYTVNETSTPSGIEYVHQDPDTTAILNYLSGKEDLPQHIKLEAFQRGLIRIAESHGQVLPENFKQLSEEELRNLLIKFVTPGTKDRDAPFTSPEITANWYFKMMVPQYEWNPRLHKMLWELEKETGNPKIRITFEGPLLDRDSERAFFNPATNTAHIFIDNAFSDLIAELAHAKQLEDENLLKHLKSIGNLFQVGFDAVFKYSSINEAYDVSYQTPGSIEYEAHKVIEPKILEGFKEEEPKEKKDSTPTQQTVVRR